MCLQVFTILSDSEDCTLFLHHTLGQCCCKLSWMLKVVRRLSRRALGSWWGWYCITGFVVTKPVLTVQRLPRRVTFLELQSSLEITLSSLTKTKLGSLRFEKVLFSHLVTYSCDIWCIYSFDIFLTIQNTVPSWRCCIVVRRQQTVMCVHCCETYLYWVIWIVINGAFDKFRMLGVKKNQPVCSRVVGS